MRRLLCFVPLTLFLGTAPLSAHDETSPGDVLAAWSQFVSADASGATAFPISQPVLEFRYVVAAGSHTAGSPAGCGDFTISYTDSHGATGTAKAGSARTNYDTLHFPIVVCAVQLDADWTELSLETGGSVVTIKEDGSDTGVKVTVPGPYAIGRRHEDAKGDPELLIATLGDSGCRGHSQQTCDSYSWPFQRITEHATEASPDLFVHVGDYRYYEQSAQEQRWDYWLKDLLVPARRALLAAPWAFTRGNHEECGYSHSGIGFTYLFGVGGAGCSGSEADVEPSWSFDVAPGGIESSGKASNAHRFVMIDTSDEHSSELNGAFADAIDRSQTGSVWWVSHVPPVHLLNYGGRMRPYNGNVRYRLEQAVNNSQPLCDISRTASPRCSPSLILLGHDHMYQTVTFSDANGAFTWPQIYIVGHGGVNLRSAGLSGSSCTYDFNDLPGSKSTQTGIVHTRREFGYVLWRRSAATIGEQSGWVADPRDRHGKPWRPFAAARDDC